MSSGRKVGGLVGILIVCGLIGWISTAPYLSNQGLGRTPGVIIGGTLTEAPTDLASLNGPRGPLTFKQAGFPPFVNYLSWVATSDGVITATRPDNGYWARRVRERGGDGWLRIEDSTYAMTATEVVGDSRLPLLELWGQKAGRSLDEVPYSGAEPLRDWEVFVWTPQ